MKPIISRSLGVLFLSGFHQLGLAHPTHVAGESVVHGVGVVSLHGGHLVPLLGVALAVGLLAWIWGTASAGGPRYRDRVRRRRN